MFNRAGGKTDVDGYARLACLLMVAALPLLLVVHRAMADVFFSLVALVFLLRSIWLRDWECLKPIEHRWMIGLWLYTCVLVAPFADDRLKAMEEALIWIRFPVLFMALRCWLVKSRDDVKLLLAIMLPTLAVAWLDTVTQAVTGHSLSGHEPNFGRLTGPLEKPVIGMYLAKLSLGLCGGIMLLFLDGKRWRSVAAMMVLAAMVWTVFASGERTASILYIGGVGTMLLAIAWRRPAFRLPMLAGVALMACGMALMATQSDFLQERLTLLEEQASSPEAVMEKSPYGQLWEAAWISWKDAPVLGHGIRSFRKLCPPLAKEHAVWYCDLHPHNHYMEWLVETGLIGVMGYLGLAVLLVWQVARGLRRADIADVPQWAAALGMLVLCFFPGATQSFFSNWPAILHWLGLSMAIAVLNVTFASATRP